MNSEREHIRVKLCEQRTQKQKTYPLSLSVLNAVCSRSKEKNQTNQMPSVLHVSPHQNRQKAWFSYRNAGQFSKGTKLPLHQLQQYLSVKELLDRLAGVLRETRRMINSKYHLRFLNHI